MRNHHALYVMPMPRLQGAFYLTWACILYGVGPRVHAFSTMPRLPLRAGEEYSKKKKKEETLVLNHLWPLFDPWTST
jgi:hypothetical protein